MARRRGFDGDDETTDVDIAPAGASGPPRPPITTSQILRRAETNIRLAQHEITRHDEEASLQRRRAEAAEELVAQLRRTIARLETRVESQAMEILRLKRERQGR